MTKDAAVQMEKEIGAFEITAEQRELAKENIGGYKVIDAGRGNPNWINTKARFAFTRFMNFALSECQRTLNNGDMAGHADKSGIGERFDKSMNPADKTDAFLIKAIDYCVKNLNMNKDEIVYELVCGIIGDFYPSPSRCLKNTEVILNHYLESVLYNGKKLADQTYVLPTEGGSAAMCYIFHTLSHNKLLKPGDKIAIATPIFTPYLQIPSVNNYGLVSIDVASEDKTNWDISDKELAKLESKEIKAFFLVNPSNPASHALSDATLKKLEEVVKKNPDLIILTDDVYGTFVNSFETVYARIPYNTILVYSYSKLYGATGWRIGLIATNKDNVMDKLLARLPAKDKNELNKEYSIVTAEPESMKFIDRVAADSRSIGLYHTSGLSTPSQVFMSLIALTNLVEGGKDLYIEQSNELVRQRYITLMSELHLEADASDENASYYTLINVNDLIKRNYDEKFASWKIANKTDIQFLNDLAKKKGVVLMYGPGFDAQPGTVRISLANNNEEDYKELARRLFELLDEYHKEYIAQ
ncbi:MAG: bifunctional aspartate transaminase/aspartate 4-decarboxylase [Treponema sp.]|nr:bifunctional aspartate transaminase/aspartate 4-decarboxylase [Treponema sp.]